MDKLLDQLTEYLKAASTVIGKYGPQVWDATLTLVRLNAIFDLVTLTIVTVASVWGLRWVLKFCAKKMAARESQYDCVDLWYMLLLAPGAGLLVSTISWLCSFQSWLALFSPQLAVLYKVASKAGLL